jgi:hypothetical protein
MLGARSHQAIVVQQASPIFEQFVAARPSLVVANSGTRHSGQVLFISLKKWIPFFVSYKIKTCSGFLLPANGLLLSWSSKAQDCA